MVLDNGIIRWEAVAAYDGVIRQTLICLADCAPIEFLRSDYLLGVGQNAIIRLPFATVEWLGDTAVRLGGECGNWRYELDVRLESGASWLDCEARLETSAPFRGWFHYAIGVPCDADCWIYPWLNAGRDVAPTHDTRSLGMDVPGQIRASLVGVPIIIARSGELIGGVGFLLEHNYRTDSLAHERVADRQMIGLGSGSSSGTSAFSGSAQYVPGRVYAFKFQVFALKGGFRELAHAWAKANDLRFDRFSYRSIDEAIDIVIDGRSQDVCSGLARYIREDVNGLPVAGYRHSSGRQNRISIYRQSWNAYIDYILFLRTGREVFRQRAIDQMGFLLAAQTAGGWFREDWHIEARDWGFEVLPTRGGAAQVTDKSLELLRAGAVEGSSLLSEVDRVSGRNMRGPRPDYLGMTCHYIHKMAKLYEREVGTVRRDWLDAMNRCLDWLLRNQHEDGSWAMTVSADGSGESASAPMGRLIVALDYLAAELCDSRLDEARDKHERWLLANCVAKQQWYGSHKDTGLTIDYGGLHNFIQYCVQRYERTGDSRYLDYALECTYFNFFEHCPKQLEWLWHYSKWGIMEQACYMQYDIDNMDNLPIYTWFKLAEHAGDEFVREMVDQALHTAMHTLCDDESHPWYGSWGQYLVDPIGSVGHYDQSPVNGTATKYAGSIVCSVVEELLLLKEAGYEGRVRDA